MYHNGSDVTTYPFSFLTDCVIFIGIALGATISAPFFWRRKSWYERDWKTD